MAIAHEASCHEEPVQNAHRITKAHEEYIKTLDISGLKEHPVGEICEESTRVKN